MEPSESQRIYEGRLNAVLQHIHENLESELSTETLAEIACFSPFHFHRVFTAFIGEPPGEYIKRLRLEAAANCLRLQPRRSITDIAIANGYTSLSAFARSFRERFGMSASEWRERGKNSFGTMNSKIGTSDGRIGKDRGDGENYVDAQQNDSLPEWSVYMEFEVVQLNPIHVAYLRNKGGYVSSEIGQTWERLCRWAGPRGLLNGETRYIGISWDDPDITPADKCRYYACVSIAAEQQVDGEIGEMTIEGGTYVKCYCEITEGQFKEAYNRIYKEWIPTGGYQPADKPCFEEYLNDPNQDPERKFIMNIYVPIIPL